MADLLWNYLFSFLLGGLGALFIVWLRWTDALPRFKSAIEISLLEDEYNKIRDHIGRTIKDDKTLDSSDVKYSDQLRDDIWRQRSTSFLFSSILYVILGGATALIFIGLDAQNIFDTTTILKLISAGALWSSFYSFIEVKNAESFKNTEQEAEDKKQQQVLEAVKKEYDAQISELEDKTRKCVTEANNTVSKLIKDYNDLVDEYEKQKLTVPAGGKT